MPIHADSPAKLLLVEGLTDKWAVRGIRHNCCDDLRFAIHEKKGLPALIGSIQPECKVEDRDALGLVVDADQDPQDHWDRIRESLGEIDIPAPIVPKPEGTLIETAEQFVGVSRIGIWIMPDNRCEGMLEDLLVRLIPNESTDLYELAQNCVGEARSNRAPFKDAHESKAEVFTWLAWQDPPGLRLHEAVNHRVLDPTRPESSPFVRWFRKLYRL